MAEILAAVEALAASVINDFLHRQFTLPAAAVLSGLMQSRLERERERERE